MRPESGVLTWPVSIPPAPGAQRHGRSAAWGQLHSEVCQSDLQEGSVTGLFSHLHFPRTLLCIAAHCPFTESGLWKE